MHPQIRTTYLLHFSIYVAYFCKPSKTKPRSQIEEVLGVVTIKYSDDPGRPCLCLPISSRQIPLSLFVSQTPAVLPSGGHTALRAGAAGPGSLWQDLMSFSFHRPHARPFAVWRIRRPRLYARTGGNATARLFNGDPRRERPSEFLIVTRSQDGVDEIGSPRYLMLTGSPHIAFPPLHEIALCQRGVFVNHAFSEIIDEDR